MNRRKFILWLSGLVAAFLAVFRLRWLTKSPPALPKPLEQPEDPYRSSQEPWKDFWAMSQDIVNHVDQTGEPVLVADNPLSLRIGFGCDTKTWEISLVKLRESLATQPEKAELLKAYVSTVAGRRKLAAAMQGAGMNRRKARGLV